MLAGEEIKSACELFPREDPPPLQSCGRPPSRSPLGWVSRPGEGGCVGHPRPHTGSPQPARSIPAVLGAEGSPPPRPQEQRVLPFGCQCTEDQTPARGRGGHAHPELVGSRDRARSWRGSHGLVAPDSLGPWPWAHSASPSALCHSGTLAFAKASWGWTPLVADREQEWEVGSKGSPRGSRATASRQRPGEAGPGSTALAESCPHALTFLGPHSESYTPESSVGPGAMGSGHWDPRRQHGLVRTESPARVPSAPDGSGLL